MDGICLTIVSVAGDLIVHLIFTGIVLSIGQIGHLIIHFTLIIIVGIGLIGDGILLGGMDLGRIQVTM
jgi:hypothetical protein